MPPPAQPLEYGWVERITDWCNAGRDGRAGLPDGEVGPEMTPTSTGLVRLFQERAASERWLMTQDTKNHRARLAVLKQNIEDKHDELAQIHREASAMPRQPTEEQLTERRGGESDTDELITRGRRKREHEDERRTLAVAYESAQRQLSQDQAEYDRIQREITDREQQMVNQWGRLYAHYSRRIMGYTKRLYWVHPDGQYLQAYLPELGQRELEGTLHQLLELTGARYLDPQSIPDPQLAKPGTPAITPGSPIDQPPKEHPR